MEACSQKLSVFTAGRKQTTFSTQLKLGVSDQKGDASSLWRLCFLICALLTQGRSLPEKPPGRTCLSVGDVHKISSERGKKSTCNIFLPHLDWYHPISKEKMSVILNLKYFYPFVSLDPNLITLG